MLRRTVCHLSLLAAVTVPAAGCFWPQGVATPVFTQEDVSMDTPSSTLRVLGEKGEVMELADEVSVDVNRWVGHLANSFGEMLEELNATAPTEEDGNWRIYGPHNDEDGANASWLARVSGDEEAAEFEVLVGERGVPVSEMSVVFTGQLAVDGSMRNGGFTIDFDVISKLEALNGEYDGEEFGGNISVEFSRDIDTKYKYVDLDFDDFWYVDPSEDEDLNYKDESYAYHRENDGAGVFHFATWAAFEEEGWSGPERERVTVDMAWNRKDAGRARAQILEVDGQGDLRHGDLMLNECFGVGSALTWAHLNEPYASEYPEYNEGDEAACVIAEDALDGFE